MSKRSVFILAMLGLALGLGGCVSVVKVAQAKPDTKGIRYFLPEVFIQVTPNQDGTVTVEKVFLPDPKREYAISAESYMSSYKLDVERDEKGLLKSVTFNNDSAAVANQLIGSAANVRAAQIDARTAKAKAESEDEKAAAEKAKAALDAADKLRRDAATTLDVVNRKLQLLLQRQQEKSPPKDIEDQILSVRLEIVEAEAKRDAAEAAYSSLLSKTQTPVLAAGNAPNTESSWPQAMEPVFYRVVMSEDGVMLKQAFDQKPRATWIAPKTEGAPALEVLPASFVVRPAEKTGALSKTVQLTVPARAVAALSFVRAKGNAALPVPVVSLLVNRTSVDVEVPKGVAAGDYELDVSITPAKPDDAKPVKRTMQVRVEK